MNIKVFQNRKIEKDYFYNEGTQNENKSTVLTFEVPLGYEDFSKRIVFITEDGNFWDYIPENEYEIKNNITKYGAVEAYLWLTKDDQDFRSETFELNFFKNENADDLVPAEEEIDGFKTLIAELDLKIAEVEALKVEIGDFQQALNSKATKEELKTVDAKFENYYLKTETYNKEEIDNKISVIPKFNRIVVDELPTENIREDAVYLVPSQGDTNDLYREYLYINGNWELIGIQKGDLSNIYTKQEVDEMVKEIQETNEYQSEIIDQFKNEFKQITVSGDSIYIADAAELPMELVPYGEPVQNVIEEELGTTVEGESVVVTGGNPEKEVKATVNGNSYQETTKGYNLLDLSDLNKKTIDGVTFTPYFNEDGTLLYVNVNGTNTSSSTAIYSNDNVNIENEQAYRFNGCPANGSTSSYMQTLMNMTTYKGVDDLGEGKTFTGTEDKYQYRIRIASGYTANNLKFYPMLKKGTEEKPFEPYTNGVATPNTNHKQDIEVIDTVNEFDTSEFVEEESFGITLTKGEDGTVILNGTSTGSTMFRILRTEKTILGTGKQALTINKLDGTITGGDLKFIAQDIDYGNLAYSQIGTAIINQKLINGITYNIFAITITSGTVCNNLKLGLMISEITSPYLPYGHIGLVQRGKSLVDFGNPTGKSVIENFSFENDTLSITSKKSSFPYVYWNILDIIKKNAGKTLFLNFENIDFIAENKSLVQLTIINNGVSSYPQLITTGGVKNPYTIPEDVSGITKCLLQLMVNNSAEEKVVSINITRPILSFKENDTYEPYIEPIVHEIDLAGESLAKVGEIADLLNIGVDGSVKLNKKTVSDILDGVTNKFISKSGTTNNNLIFTSAISNILATSSNDIEVVLYSNYFKSSFTNDIYMNSKLGICINMKGEIGVGFGLDSEINTVELANAWLQEKNNEGNPFELLIPLQKQYYETIPLPSIEPIELFEGTNVFELVTNLGTTMALTYDYVTPSPSIDRPSEILTVKGSYRTEKVNENLLPRDFTNINDSQNIKVSQGEYTFYFNAQSKVGDMGINILGLYEGDTTGTKLFDNQIAGWTTPNIGYNAVVLSLTKKIKKLIINGYGFGKIDSCMLVKGALVDKNKFNIVNISEYTPHQSSTLPLTLTNELLGEIVTLSEEEAKQLNLDGAGKYRRTDYGRSILDGVINKFVGKTGTTKNNLYATIFIKNNVLKPDTDAIVINHFCNCFLPSSGNNLWNNDIKGSAIRSDGSMAFGFGLDSDINTLEKANEYITQNPIEVIYPLKTPTYEKITDETELEQLSAYDKQIAFYGVNNINTFATDDLEKAPLGIHATYSKSNKLTIQSLEDRLASLESQVTNLQDNQI